MTISSKTFINYSSFLLLSFAVSLFHACKKEDQTPELTIQGTIFDNTTQAGVPGVSVRLSEQVVSGGTFSSVFQTISTVTTSSNGSYSFNFPREAASAYRLEISRENYFSRELDINPDNVSVGSPYSSSLGITPMAWAKFSMVNASPLSAADVATFQYLNASFTCSCCNNEQSTYTGMNVNSSEKCLLEGNFMLRYRYTVNKDTLSLSVIDSAFCAAFDTTFISINY